MKKTVLPLLISLSLFGKEFYLNKKSIDTVLFETTKDITADLIDNDSLSYSEAKTIFDQINMEFEQKKSTFKTKILKLSINASYLNRGIKEKLDEIASIKSLLKSKNAKLIQVESDIKSENSYIQQLQKLVDRKIEFNSNISTQGYLVAFVENRRSVSRDKFIASATESINSEAIQQLNGILVNSISKYDKQLSMEIRETSSGTAITDSSDTTVKVFFASGKRHSVLIYGTKVDVYPFENGEIINRVNRKDAKNIKYLILIRNENDIKNLIEDIKLSYPNFKVDQNLKKRVKKAIFSIDIHNRKSREVIIEIDQNHKQFVAKMQKRVSARSEVIKVLTEHKKLLLDDIAELQLDTALIKKDKHILDDKFKLIQKEIIEVKRSISFTKAEMYDRKHSNAVKETQTIVRELLKDIDRSMLKTSKKMETIFNGSKIIKDIVDEVEYEKIYLKSNIIPYFVDNTDRTGALVTLEIKFKDKKLAKEQPLNSIDFVKIPKGTFKFGSNVGDSDERPIRKLDIKKDFLIGKYEVTVQEYMEFAETTKSHYPEWYNNLKKRVYKNQCLKDSCPIIGVSWLDAKAYTKWISKRDGKTYRLPTEFEWEYVSKGDLNRDYGFLYGNLKDYSWFAKNGDRKNHRVGLKKPNLFGVYDMQGNVWELCENSYHHNYLNKREDSYKVMRGGDWRTKKYYLRSSNRAKYRKDRKGNSVGFRIVQEVE